MRPSTFPMYDRIVGGSLADLLRQWRSEDQSYDAVAIRLAVEHDIHVTPKTVSRWLKALEDEAA